jgi:hypothetical protein
MTDNKTSYNNTKYASVKRLTVMVDNKTSCNNANYAPDKPQTVMADNKNQLQQYELCRSQTSKTPD